MGALGKTDSQAGDLGASPVALADFVPHLDKEGPEALTH